MEITLSAQLDHEDPDIAPMPPVALEETWSARVRWAGSTYVSRLQFLDEETALLHTSHLVEAVLQLRQRHPPATRCRWTSEILTDLGMQRETT